jgi:hypothetical protein
MKKYLAALFVFLVLFPNVFSTMGVLCQTDSPYELMVTSTNFGSAGEFSIKLVDVKGGNIEVVSVQPKGILVIEGVSSEPVDGGKLTLISGSYPKSVSHLDEQISLFYTDKQGNKKEAIIRCQGIQPEVGWMQFAVVTWASFICSLVFFGLGILALFYGYKRGKKKIKVLGFLLLLLSASVFAAFILLFFTNP